MENLREIDRLGYKFYFNYTITGLPKIFESNVVGTDIAIDTMKRLSRMFSPRHINWRYDPILISDLTDRRFHLENFSRLASIFEGHVERCIFSFPMLYGKVKRSFAKFEGMHGIKIFDPDLETRISLACELAEIAEGHGIKMITCCGDYLIGGKIEKAHCVDGKLIEELFPGVGFSGRRKPSRKECGCTESTDIGAYDTCPHGCVYCYANSRKSDV